METLNLEQKFQLECLKNTAKRLSKEELEEYLIKYTEIQMGKENAYKAIIETWGL